MEILEINNKINQNKDIIFRELFSFIERLEPDEYEETKTYVPYGDTYVAIAEPEEDSLFEAQKELAISYIKEDGAIDHIPIIHDLFKDEECEIAIKFIDDSIIQMMEGL